MGWTYAVTTDGANTWSVWDALRDLPGCAEREEENYGYIERVSISNDGAGVMYLNPIRWKEVTQLRTQDWGKHWSIR